MTRPTQYTPQSDYLATRAQLLGETSQRVLVYLYQPLIGAVASALYQTLWTQVKAHPQFTRDRQPHSKLLQTLGCDMEGLYEARIRLEAVGLIRTYTQVDTSRHYVYELYAPLAADKFFAEDLLSIALYDTVGPDEYARLTAAFTVTPVRRSDMQELTLGFMDVYHIASSLVNVPEGVTSAREVTAGKVNPLPHITTDVVDWQLLTRLLAKTPLRHDALSDQRELLAQVAGFYALTTAQLARAVQHSLDDLTGSIDPYRLRRIAEREHGNQSALKRQQEYGQQPSLVQDVNQEKTTHLEVSLSNDERVLLQRAKSMSVRDFLDFRKKERNPRLEPQDSEIFAFSELLRKNTFDTPTINILIDYLLRIDSFIPKSMIGAVVTRWVDAGVDSPESALVQIRAHEQGKDKKVKRGRSGYSKPRRVEQKPAWEQPGYTVPKKTLTVAERDAMNAKLTALKNQQTKEEQ